MLRDWLMAPFLNPATASQVSYNLSHCSTRSTIERERCKGVLKRRWHCLHAELRFVHTEFIPVVECNNHACWKMMDEFE